MAEVKIAEEAVLPSKKWFTNEPVQTVRILLHGEDAHFADRTDIAIFINGVCRHIYTIGVNNGNMVGALHHPFVYGMSVEEAYRVVQDYNSYPADWTCKCGSLQDYHTKSAACYDRSELSELSLDEAKRWAQSAKRVSVRKALGGKLKHLENVLANRA